MRLSINELKAALRRCFEATGYNAGNDIEAADTVLWLEQHGFGGCDAFIHTLPFLDTDTDRQPVSIVSQDGPSLVIDTRGRSVLNCFNSCLDVAEAELRQHPVVTIILHHCHNRKFILKGLVECSQRGISTLAYWKNGSDTVTEHIATMGQHAPYPAYYEREIDAGDVTADDLDTRQSLTLLCSSTVLLSSPKVSADEKITEMSPQLIASINNRALEKGLSIDSQLWQSINRIGAGVLVENSDASRQGAGS